MYQSADLWRALVNAAMNLSVMQRRGCEDEPYAEKPSEINNHARTTQYFRPNIPSPRAKKFKRKIREVRNKYFLSTYEITLIREGGGRRARVTYT